MRLRYFIIAIGSILVAACATAQKQNKYYYSYRFNLDMPCDSASFELFTLSSESDSSSLVLNITDKYSHPLIYLTIQLTGNPKNIITLTDTAGLFKTNLPPAKYILSVYGVGYKTFSLPLLIEENKKYNLRLVPAKDRSLQWYDIHSKKPLSSREVEAIKECVQRDPSAPFKCKTDNAYYVTMEI